MILRAILEESKKGHKERTDGATLNNVKAYIADVLAPDNKYDIHSHQFKHFFTQALDKMCDDGLAHKPTSMRVKLVAKVKEALLKADGARQRKVKPYGDDDEDDEENDEGEGEGEEEGEGEAEGVEVETSKTPKTKAAKIKTPSTKKARK